MARSSARHDIFSMESSVSSPRTSDGGESTSSLPRDTLIDILGPPSAFSNSNMSSASNFSVLEDTDSEENYDSAPESSGARLRVGSGLPGSLCSSRPPSRSVSPLPGSSAATPLRPLTPSGDALSPSTSSSALHHHIHHHYHHTSRRPGTAVAPSMTPTASKESAKESTDFVSEYMPAYFAAEHYRTSNLARKLGFFSSADASKRRRGSAGRGWFGGRRRDSNAEAPPSYSRSASYTRLGSAAMDMSGSTSSLTSLLPAASTNVSPIRRRRCDKADHWIDVITRQPFVPTQPLSILFTLVLIASFIFSLTTYTKHALNNDKSPVPWRTFCQEQSPFPHDLADSLAPVNVFVGVFSVDAAYERRHLIRSTYVRHSKPIDPRTGRPATNVQVKFILGRPRDSHARRVALEMETYGDVVVLDMKENMNKGKTHAFFTWANENATVPLYYKTPKSENIGLGFQKVDYVVKADDDAFLVLSELERHLRVSPRTKTYWGYLIRNLFMGGEAYALSSDLVEYVANTPALLDHADGKEDKRVARWMRLHPEATSINWVTERCYIYDHPKASTTYAHGFLFPDEVERIRLEGRRGITEEESKRRGGAGTWAQSWSSVTQWKTAYAQPAVAMTMEEEVEALIEGGGRWGEEDDWKREPVLKDNYLKYELNRFSPADGRLTDSAGSALGLAASHTKPLVATSTINDATGRRFNRIPTHLLVDSEEPIVGLVARNLTLANPTLDDPLQKSPIDFHLPRQKFAQLPTEIPYSEKFVPPPVLRHDPATLNVRQRRHIGLPYGGTVVVHYLKQNEWFLETSLALLGRHNTWDAGLEPLAYSSPPLIAALEEWPSVRALAPLAHWDGKGSLEVLDSRWGTARMYGSPIIRENGYISEGRESPFERLAKVPVQQAPPSSGRWGKLKGSPRQKYADPAASSSLESDKAVVSDTGSISPVASSSILTLSSTSESSPTEDSTSLSPSSSSVHSTKSASPKLKLQKPFN